VLLHNAKRPRRAGPFLINFDQYHDWVNRTHRCKNKYGHQTAFSVENYVDYLSGCVGKIPVSPLVTILRSLLCALSPYLSMTNPAFIVPSGLNPGRELTPPILGAFHNRP
jgi:hypothetical protein